MKNQCPVCGGTAWDFSCDIFSDDPVHFDVCANCGFIPSGLMTADESRANWLKRQAA